MEFSVLCLVKGFPKAPGTTGLKRSLQEQALLLSHPPFSRGSRAWEDWTPQWGFLDLGDGIAKPDPLGQNWPRLQVSVETAHYTHSSWAKGHRPPVLLLLLGPALDAMYLILTNGVEFGGGTPRSDWLRGLYPGSWH